MNENNSDRKNGRGIGLEHAHGRGHGMRPGKGLGVGHGYGMGLSRGYEIERATTQRIVPKVTITKEECSGCMLCLKACPFNAIKRGEDRKAFIDYSICRSCGICIPSCPTKALFWEEPQTTRLAGGVV